MEDGENGNLVKEVRGGEEKGGNQEGGCLALLKGQIRLGGLAGCGWPWSHTLARN